MLLVQKSHKQIIQQFFKEITRKGEEHFEQLIKEFSINTELLMPFAEWAEEGKYHRICLGEDKSCELILICWSADVKTPIHNHNGEKCWVHFVDGTIKEVLYDAETGREIIKENIVNPGSTTFLSDETGYHSLENISGQRAMSLHLYANPIKECLVFNKKDDQFETKQLTYDYHISEL